MVAIKRALLALLIGEVIALVMAAPVVALGLFWVTDPAARIICGLLAPVAWLIVGPALAFDAPGLPGGIHGQLKAADDKREAEMAKLLAEHGSDP